LATIRRPSSLLHNLRSAIRNSLTSSVPIAFVHRSMPGICSFVIRHLSLIGLALAIAGCFGPWVDHGTAALTVTGFELAEFAKFFPQVQGGTVPIARELFYLPFVVALVLLALLAGQSTLRAVRLTVPLLIAVLLVSALLPYSIVDAARQALAAGSPLTLDPQAMPQLALVVGGTVLALLAHRLPHRLRPILVAILTLAGIIPPLWQFALLRPLVAALYTGDRNGPIRLGWGLVACIVGFALLLISSIPAGVGGRRRRRHG